MLKPKNNHLHEFLTEKIAQQDAFTLLKGLTIWLRQGKAKRAPERIALLIQILQNDTALCQQTAILLCRWLCSLRLYPLFIGAGIFSRDGFSRELIDRLYEKFNPAYKDPHALRDVFLRLFIRASDRSWIEAVPPRTWLKLFHLLRKNTPENDRETAQRYLHREGFHAIEMLSIWVAAEALEPNLIRLDNKLLDRDSAFVALKREVAMWLAAKEHQQEFDDSHLHVMLGQCRRQVESLRKKGAGVGAGSSMNVAHLLQRLDQTFDRMILLFRVFSRQKPSAKCLLQLVGTLANASAEQHSVSRLWKSSVGMLSRSITQNTSGHGEHYITRNKKEYMGMVWSAAGGGVLIALMALLKIYLGRQIDNPLMYGIASGLNYGLGFALIFMLHFTVATKQPAMTASLFAKVVERNDKGTAVNMKLAQLLVDVARSQMAAVAGNVLVAISVAMLVGAGFWLTQKTPILTAEEVAYQLKSVNPFGATLWYATIAGVWLFLSGIISGFLDNRADYLNLRMRLRHHPILRRMLPEKWRGKMADYIHKNYGSLGGNICFGMLLGMTGFVGHALGLPLDIRHVAFSSANIGYAVASGGVGVWLFIQSIVFVLMIGCVNLWVSFSLTLAVALRSRETKIGSWLAIWRCVRDIVQARPLSLILPIGLATDEANETPKEITK
ncbi:recombinase [Wielerella bovis]|uniref:site-specific recombinase n=1 Tax=Wielerella bovis TaxID=2917790 RepID=UPI002019A673|nr:recombinase [Wielerella bovis]ULJ69431.1 recombinase [Wielerella bovis]